MKNPRQRRAEEIPSLLNARWSDTGIDDGEWCDTANCKSETSWGTKDVVAGGGRMRNCNTSSSTKDVIKIKKKRCSYKLRRMLQKDLKMATTRTASIGSTKRRRMMAQPRSTPGRVASLRPVRACECECENGERLRTCPRRRQTYPSGISNQRNNHTNSLCRTAAEKYSEDITVLVRSLRV